MKSPNYILKAKILDTELVSLIKNIKYHMNLDNGVTNDFLIDSWSYIYTYYSKAEIDEAYRIINNDSHRTCRLRDRIERLTSMPSIFLTLTFTDDVLSRTSSATRRRYVTRFLKCVATDYVGNIDFGELNGREHYHAVVQSDRVDPKLWIYGNLDFKKIVYTESSSSRVAKYINKLTNHAVKSTTKRNTLLYPKKKS